MEKQDRELLSKTAGTGGILCPFFSAHGRTTIRCFDIMPGTVSTSTVFRNGKEKEFHSETYCQGAYRMCPLYRVAMAMQFE